MQSYTAYRFINHRVRKAGHLFMVMRLEKTFTLLHLKTIKLSKHSQTRLFPQFGSAKFYKITKIWQPLIGFPNGSMMKIGTRKRQVYSSRWDLRKTCWRAWWSEISHAAEGPATQNVNTTWLDACRGECMNGCIGAQVSKLRGMNETMQPGEH